MQTITERKRFQLAETFINKAVNEIAGAKLALALDSEDSKTELEEVKEKLLRLRGILQGKQVSY
jgi:hypothetical protein